MFIYSIIYYLTLNISWWLFMVTARKWLKKMCSAFFLDVVFSGKMYTGKRIDSIFSTKQISGWSVSQYSLEFNLFQMSRQFRSWCSLEPNLQLYCCTVQFLQQDKLSWNILKAISLVLNFSTFLSLSLTVSHYLSLSYERYQWWNENGNVNS